MCPRVLVFPVTTGIKTKLSLPFTIAIHILVTMVTEEQCILHLGAHYCIELYGQELPSGIY